MNTEEPAAAEPPAPTGDNDADTQALIEAWGEPEVQAEGMSVKQWERHVADLRERAAQPPRGVTPALDVERLEQVAESLKVELRYVGPGDDADAEEWLVFAAEYARLGSEPTALPKSPEDSDG